MIRRVAISQRVVESPSYEESRDALAHDWMEWAQNSIPNASLFQIPNRPEELPLWFGALEPDLVVLSGGNNWGERAERDDTERLLVEIARAKGLPIIGVCRGLQVLNKLYGGEICTDIHAAAGSSHVATNHLVKITHTSFSDMSKSGFVSVNSYHDQGVLLRDLAPGLLAFALGDGDVVEGFVHVSEPILSVQWHPERNNPGSFFDEAIVEKFLSRGVFWQGQS